jgi:Tol biopolymer transport system component/tRNA A-37 threonylcarbamoyl transferase component Bud32
MSSSSLVGQTIGGRYQIQSVIGMGGMASVYKAYDPNLRRAVAIKVIHPHLSNNPEFFRRFEEEAAAVAHLRHPNIVQMYDFSHEGDLYYMVMEFVIGETLQTRLREMNASGQRMNIKDVTFFTAEICDAANYAHKRRMIHRDIKPANIMLDSDGNAILMDFGIARLVDASQHTASGAVLGTALYMSPEQIQGTEIDARADIYSIGITLFEMLSGKPPFDAKTVMTLMMMHLNNPVPDLHELQPDIPAELIAITNKALSKNRDERFQTAGDMAAALRHLPQQPQETAKVISQTLAEATFIETALDKETGETTVEPTDFPNPAVLRYPSTIAEQAAQPVEIMEESAAQAYPASTQVERRKMPSWVPFLLLLLVIGVGGYFALTRFLPGSGLFSLKVSPTAQTSGYVQTPTSFVVALENTPTLPPTDQQILTSLVINQGTPSPVSARVAADYANPHGKIVFTCSVYLDSARYQICMINADGTGFKQLTSESSNYYPSMAPNGQSVVFVSFRTDIWQIYELELDSGIAKQITNGSEEWSGPEISPDGRSIAASKNVNDYQEIWMMDRNGGNQVPLVQMSTDCLDPTWSPDGEKILFACGPATGRQLYTIDLTDKQISKITNLPDLRGRSDWSPDGSEIASYLGPEWHREIVLLSNNGSIIKTLTDGGNNLAPSYSPDGAWIAFTSYKDLYGDNEGCEIYIMLTDGTNVRRLTKNKYCDWQPRWGP